MQIRTYIAAFGFALTGGCANPAMQKATSVLGIPGEYIAYDLPDGYVTSQNIADILRKLSAVLNGTLKVKKTTDGYLMEGEYDDRDFSSESLLGVCREADVITPDKVITWEEAANLEKRICEEKSR